MDVLPGDRANPCQGKMKPTGYVWQNSKIDIEFKCLKCGHLGKNRANLDDENGSDEVARLIEVLEQGS